MDRQVPHRESDASLRVLLPILGLGGGLGLGAVRAWLAGAVEIGLVTLVVSGGIIGSALGTSAVLMCASWLGQVRLRSLKSLAFLVLIAALVPWFALTMLAAVFAGCMA